MTVLVFKSQEFEPFVKAEQAAEFLGFSPITVRRMSRDGELPCVRFARGRGHVWRYRMSELAQYVQSGKRLISGN